MYDLWRATPTSPVNISESFTSQDFATAIKHLKSGKAGPDSICLELISHARAALKSWLRSFLSSCLRHLKIPKVWRRALVVAIPKPKKPVKGLKSYRLIFLLCVSCKILERLIHFRVEPIVDPLLPREQTGCRRGRLTVDQIALLTQNIEDSFEAKKKAGAVFVDRMIMELVRNRSLTLTTGDSKHSRLRRLRNDLPQESVLASSFSTSTRTHL